MPPLEYTADGLPYYTPDPETANPLYDAAPQEPAAQPLPVDASAMTFNDSTGVTAFDKLLGVGGQERYQTWPEKMVRDAIAAPHDVLNNPNPQTSEDLIKPAMDIASLAGGGGLATGLPEGAIGSVGSKLVQPAMKDAPVFYSAVENAVKNSTQNVATPDQWIGFLKNQPGVKQEELQWMGLDDPTNLGNQPVTKTDLENYVQNHKVELQEVNKINANEFDPDAISDKSVREHFGMNRNDFDNLNLEGRNELRNKYMNEVQGGQPTKFFQYQLPGGENYREKLLTLPQKTRQAPVIEKNQFGQYNVNYPDGGFEGGYTLAEAQQAASEFDLSSKHAIEAPIFKSSHWDEPNVLAHVRMNDRNIPDIGKSLHLEEVQSDWHQKGRQQGYKISDEQKAKADAIDEKLLNHPEAEKIMGNPDLNAALKEAVDKKIISQAEADTYKKVTNNENSNIPDAPFKQTWPDLILKRMVREAAEKGYDAISWTPGAKQAERYDLSKHIDEINWNPKTNNLMAFGKDDKKIINEIVSKEKLSDFIGKEAAEKIVNTKLKAYGAGDKLHTLKNVDLKIGGEGMKTFYDKMLVDKANALAKKFGGKVEEKKLAPAYDIKIINEGDRGFTVLQNNKLMGKFDDRNGAEELMNELKEGKQGTSSEPIHVLKLTPQLKDAALKKGFPLFSGGVMLSPIEHDPYKHKLIPIEHDPFKFTPVENNPFEMSK